MADATREEVGLFTRYITSLLNSQLKSICSLNGIRANGVKADLQGRLKERESVHQLFLRNVQITLALWRSRVCSSVTDCDSSFFCC